MEEVTTGWPTGALWVAGELSRGVVETVRVEMIGGDRGFTGAIARVRMTYRDADQSPAESMVVKLPTVDRVDGSPYHASHAR